MRIPEDEGVEEILRGRGEPRGGDDYGDENLGVQWVCCGEFYFRYFLHCIANTYSVTF